MTGKTYGYARVSSDDQTLDVQREALKKAGCEMVREEKVSGASRDGRTELRILLDFIRAGDVVTVTKLDRLARDTVDMLEIIREIASKGAGFRSLAEAWATVEPSSNGRISPMAELIITIFGGVAQFDRARIKERQREGIDHAKKNGVYKGRKPSIDKEEVHRRLAEGQGPARIARELGIGESSVYRLRDELNKPQLRLVANR